MQINGSKRQAKMKKILLDNATLGVSIDSGRISSVLLEEVKGIKTLLSYDLTASKARNLDPSKTRPSFQSPVKIL